MQNNTWNELASGARTLLGIDQPREVLSGALTVILAPTLALTGAQLGIAHPHWQNFPVAALLLGLGIAALSISRRTNARIAGAWAIATLTGGGILITMIQSYLTPSLEAAKQGLEIAASGLLTGLIATALAVAIAWAWPARRR